MSRPITAALLLSVTLILAAFSAKADADSLTDRVVEVLEIDGSPAPQTHNGNLPRLRIMDGAILFSDPCLPTVIGREGLTLGTPVDHDLFVPRLAILCAQLSQESVMIGSALGRATLIVMPRDPGSLLITDGETVLMRLRFVN